MLGQMRDLVRHDIFHELNRNFYEPIIKTQRAIRRTTPPSPLRTPHRNFRERKIVQPIHFKNFFRQKLERDFFMLFEIRR